MLPIRQEVGAHVGLALVRLMIRSDLMNRRSLLRSSKHLTNCLVGHPTRCSNFNPGSPRLVSALETKIS